MTKEERISLLEQLVTKQEEYIQFLGKANEAPISIAFNHGWRAYQDDFNKAGEFRKIIGELKYKIYQQ